MSLSHDTCRECGDERTDEGGCGCDVIDMTPTWSGILPALLAIIENGVTVDARKTAEAEMQKMARLADLYVMGEKAARTLPVDQALVELATLEAVFEANGFRGVEDADRVDALRKQLRDAGVGEWADSEPEMCDECSGTRWPVEKHDDSCSLNEANVMDLRGVYVGPLDS